MIEIQTQETPLRPRMAEEKCHEMGGTKTRPLETVIQTELRGNIPSRQNTQNM